MRQLYFHRDSERGVNGTYEWLADELEELREALEGSDKEATEKEFADVIAWLASLANVAGIDLESAAIKKYDKNAQNVNRRPAIVLSSGGASVLNQSGAKSTGAFLCA